MKNLNAEQDLNAVVDVTHFGNEYRQYQLQTYVVEPTESLKVKVGKLEIVNENIGPKIGVGTRVLLDGKELERVRSVTLRIEADEVCNATVEMLV